MDVSTRNNSRAALTCYKNRIIDLSRRNRLLNFPKTAKSIAFDMRFDTFLSKFGSLDNLQIDFFHKEIEQEEAMLKQKQPDVENLGVKEKRKFAYIPPTNYHGKKLLTVLAGLRLDSKKAFDEYGLHTLFLSLGKIKWHEPSIGHLHSSNEHKEYAFSAPLILVPIQITEHRDIKKRTVISTDVHGGEIRVNTALELLLENEFKARRPVVDISAVTDWSVFFKDVCKQMRDIFSELGLTYDLTPELQIAQYSFLNEQLYQDLHANEETLMEHEFINALCSHAPIAQDRLTVSKDERCDDLLTKENDYNVLDADKSQLGVIQKALKGSHLVVQGPPGTGKSQTIVNLITNLLARKKTVLFVCEKQIALQVVYNRMREEGLDKLALFLSSAKADKKSFAKQILSDRDKIIEDAVGEGRINKAESILQAREESISELRAYAEKLGQSEKPLDRSAQWVHGELAKHRRIAPGSNTPWQGEDVTKITADYYNRVLALLNSKKELFNSRLNPALHHWKQVNLGMLSLDLREGIQACLKGIKNALKDAIKAKPDLVRYDTLADAGQLIAMPKISFDENTQGLLKSDADLSYVVVALKSIAESIEKCYVDHGQHIETYILSKIDEEHEHISSAFVVRDEIFISQVRDAYNDGPALQECIREAMELLKHLRSGTFTIVELMECKALLSIDPLIKNIQNWQSLPVLEVVSEQLKHIAQLYTLVLKSERKIHEWRIKTNTLDKRRISAISKRFRSSYTTFLRYFYPQYYKDCSYIKSRSSFSEDIDCAETVITLDEYLESSEQLIEVLNDFNQKYMIDVHISADRVFALQKNVQMLISWLTKLAIKTLPEKIERLLDYNADKMLAKKIHESIDGAYSILNRSWGWLNLYAMSSDECFDMIQQNYVSFMNEFFSIMNFFEVVNAVRKKPLIDTSFAALKKESSYIHELSDHMHALFEDKAKNVFLDKQSFIAVFENTSKLKILIEKLNVLHEIILLNKHTISGAILLEKAFAYTVELQKCIPVLESSIFTYQNNVNQLKVLFQNELAMQDFERVPFQECIAYIDVMLSDKQGLETRIEYYRYSAQLARLGLEWFLSATENIEIKEPASVFARSFLTAWLKSCYERHSELLNFDRKDHEQVIQSFKGFEASVLKTNSLRLLEMYANYFRTVRNIGSNGESVLMHQSQLKMRHDSIRRVVQAAGQRILTYKPCWMVSPIALSSHVPYQELNFDVVIFDEASQMRVEYALGAMARAKQVIIFGDEKQLPPSSFFQIASEEDDDQDMSQDYESILQATKEILPGAEFMLSYHYRSKYENLIAFSNHHVYADRLTTFPNADSSDHAVQFEYVKDGLFDGGSGGSRSNYIEAQRVAKLCIEHAQQYQQSSLGVIAFSKTQETAIRVALQEALKKITDFTVIQFLDETRNEPGSFFIKNLESVQGDERDVIILSIGYAKDKRAGKLYNRFGPINGHHGHRRLNVAVTRAKEKIICVSSIMAGDIICSDAKTEAKGVKLLKAYLEYAEKGIKALDASSSLQNQSGVEVDSPFEEEVEKGLQSRGYKVHRQIGASGFKIDLAIVNPVNEAEYILGIECDGAAYHSSYSARMNDRIRQDILERLGWKIYRIWSQHWISNREEILDEINATIKVILDNDSYALEYHAQEK